MENSTYKGIDSTESNPSKTNTAFFLSKFSSVHQVQIITYNIMIYESLLLSVCVCLLALLKSVISFGIFSSPEPKAR